MKLNDIKSLIHYNPNTGVLTWLPKGNDWDELYAWKDVKESHHVRDNMISLNDVPYQLSHIAYFMHHGEMPEKVTYIDKDKTNNRITNLRAVASDGSVLARKISTNNTSGFTGVNLRKDCNKWRAWISVEGDRKHLGYFDDVDDAITARKEAEVKYNF